MNHASRTLHALRSRSARVSGNTPRAACAPRTVARPGWRTGLFLGYGGNREIAARIVDSGDLMWGNTAASVLATIGSRAVADRVSPAFRGGERYPRSE
jgi:hypothetical protein